LKPIMTAKQWAELDRSGRIEAIRGMTEDGATAAEIGYRVGANKNIIVGLWNRYRALFNWPEKTRPGQQERARAFRRELYPDEPVRPPRPKRVRPSKPKPAAPEAIPEPVAETRPLIIVPDVPEGPVTLFTVGPFGCRFPLYDDARRLPVSEMFVCGKPTKLNSSWCPAHHRKCMVPVDKTRRQAERLAFRW
jgi:hypothetical protein